MAVVILREASTEPSRHIITYVKRARKVGVYTHRCLSLKVFPANIVSKYFTLAMFSFLFLM